jgi:hypothetical protein
MLPELKTIKIGKPAQRALELAGINSFLQLCDYSKEEILAFHGVGPKAVGILDEILIKEGYSFKK